MCCTHTQALRPCCTDSFWFCSPNRSNPCNVFYSASSSQWLPCEMQRFSSTSQTILLGQTGGGNIFWHDTSTPDRTLLECHHRTPRLPGEGPYVHGVCDHTPLTTMLKTTRQCG